MAQSISGTNLLANWRAKVSYPVCRVRCDWNKDGDFTDIYEDITGRVLSVQTRNALYQTHTGLPRMGEEIVGEATIVCSNDGQWFSVKNSSGLVATYSNLADGIYMIPIQIDMGYYNGTTPEYLRQFTGYIVSANLSERDGDVEIVFRCYDNAYPLRQYKYHSALLENYRTDQVIGRYLDDAGMTADDLDYGMLIIPWAYTETENLAQELCLCASSEGGWFYFSKDGKSTFRRITSLLERSDSKTPQASLDASSIFQYSDDYTWRDLYSAVRVEFSSLYRGAEAEVYRAPQLIQVPPGNEGKTILASLRWPCTAYIVPEYGVDYQALTAGADPVPSGPSGIEVSIVSSSAKELKIAFTNHLAEQAVYILDFVIRGFPLLGEEQDAVEKKTSLDLVPGTKVYPISANYYIQTREQAEVLASYLRDWIQRPHHIYRWTGPGCPWLELLDRVTLSYSAPGLNEDCYVVAIEQTFDEGGYRQSLTLLPCSDLYNHTDYFILGSSVYRDTGSDKAGY